MSSNVNIGIFDGRNSSRVLKPPGGGHSQIFGNFEEDVPRSKMKHHNSSEINACFTQPQDTIDKKGEIEHKETQKLENTENAAPVAQTDNKAGPRQRVPPGGYSSGFW